jgi:glycerol-3-phosphate dehydrogenase
MDLVIHAFVTAACKPLLILGAGINGAALARELAIAGVPVCIVDAADVASGATSASSHLIHGGLRYLEHGEFGLVRESLAERSRLLRLAPQFVFPLELFIPIANRLGGLVPRLRRSRPAAPSGRLAVASREGEPAPGESRSSEAESSAGRWKTPRGLWLIRCGLWLYDRFAREPLLPRHRTHSLRDVPGFEVDARRYRWFCSYYDAVIPFPERLVVALLHDAQAAAAEQGVPFTLLTYHRARLEGRMVEILPAAAPHADASPALAFEPAAIVNATGAWVDLTLRALQVPSKQLIGGTKGSHFVTRHAGLARRLAGRGIYAEARDLRPVFVIPLGENTLVGTTDLHFPRDPREAIADEAELDYLLDAVNRVFAGLNLTRGDVAWHFSGVRPLPFADKSQPASITRRHWLEEHAGCSVPFYSVIGGKLTTFRSLAEQATDTILRRLELPRRGAGSRQRVIPGGEHYPADDQALQAAQQRLADELQLPVRSVRAVWKLVGTRAGQILRGCGPHSGEPLAGTELPRAVVRYVIEHESVQTINDLVLRRLLLLFEPGFCRETLVDLATLLAQAGRIPSDAVVDAVTAAQHELTARHGVQW